MDPVHAVSCGPCREHGARQVLSSEVGPQRIPAAGDTEGPQVREGQKGTCFASHRPSGTSCRLGTPLWNCDSSS